MRIVILAFFIALSQAFCFAQKKGAKNDAAAPKDTVIELANKGDLASCVAFSPDGRLATGNMNGKVVFWNVEKKSIDNLLEGKSEAIVTMTFSPDGSLLATGGKDKKVTVWSVSKGVAVHTFTDHKGVVTTLSFSTDGRYLASAGTDNLIHIFDLKTGEKFKTLEGHKKDVTTLCFSHKGGYLASAGYDGTVYIWDIVSGKPDKFFNPNAGRIRCVEFHPDDKNIALGFDDETIKLWDLNSGACKVTLKGHKNVVYDLEYSPDGEYLASGGLDNTIFIWSLKTGLSVSKIDKLYKFISLSFSKDGKYLAYTDLEPAVKVVDISYFNMRPDPRLSKLASRSHYNASLINNPPKVEIIQPVTTRTKPFSQLDKKITIRGKVESDAGLLVLLVNGLETPVKEDGSFEKEVVLAFLENQISIRAIDRDKQVATDTAFIYRPLDANSTEMLSSSERHGRDYALLIGTDNYESMPQLSNPVNDVNTVSKELRDNYNFTVETVTNPTLEQIYTTLRNYNKKQFYDQDQIFIFIAGHGEYDEVFQEGYLVASDSKKNDEVKQTYLSHSNLRTLVNNIPCKHIMLVLDACFGGTFDPVVASRGGAKSDNADRNLFIMRKLNYKTRLYLTSGGKEYVPDGRPGQHSPFTRNFLEGLRSYGGGDRILTVNEVYSYIEKVTPEPRHGEFGNNEPGSDFLFIAK